MLTAAQAANYLCSYIECYRSEYARLTSGAGYPKSSMSPYLEARSVTAYLATDGAAVAVFENVDGYTKPRAPQIVMQLGDRLNLQDYVGTEAFEIMMGVFPPAIDSATGRTKSPGLGAPTVVNVLRYEMKLKDVALRLMFGGLEALTKRFRDSSSPFWDPFIIKNMCFGTTDQLYRRLDHQLEFLFHVHPAAWNSRSNWMRAHIDIGRDYVRTISDAERPEPAGTIMVSIGAPRLPQFEQRLLAYYHALKEFADLLNTEETAEPIFHELFKRNPILLDIAGDVRSKPRFQYPPDSKVRDKQYLEPDFLVVSVGPTYRLIELESPGKQTETQKGHPTSLVTQAVHQTAEWDQYIREHYDCIRDDYPGINIKCKKTVVIGRGVAGTDAERKERDQTQLTFGDVEVLSYDELYARGIEVYERLRTLGYSVAR